MGQNLTGHSTMEPREILDNFKGFKIDIPVYRILNFRAWFLFLKNCDFLEFLRPPVSNFYRVSHKKLPFVLESHITLKIGVILECQECFIIVSA